MVNHPNRGGGERPSRNPEPTEIKQARSTVGMTQEEAAAVVHSTKRVWYQWEAGLRRMHPAFWELFLMKTTRRNYDPD